MTDDVKTAQGFIQLDDDANAFDLAAAINGSTVYVILTDAHTGDEIVVSIDPAARTANVVWE